MQASHTGIQLLSPVGFIMGSYNKWGYKYLNMGYNYN